MGLSRAVSEINGDIGRKFQIFPIRVYLTTPLRDRALSRIFFGRLPDFFGGFSSSRFFSSGFSVNDYCSAKAAKFGG